MFKLIVFKCPRTGLQVQAPLARQEPELNADGFEAVKCLACTRLHFVDRATGVVLDDRPD